MQPPSRRQNDDSARPATGRRSHVVATLARQFADEPELIRALLQNIELAPEGRKRLIYQAAVAATTLCPHYADLFYHAGQAAVAVGELGVAQSLAARAVALNPAYRDALILAARVAMQRAELKRATAYLETALAAGADYPDVHELLGHAWRDQGDVERAQAAYQRALELNANLVTARSALAALRTATLGPAGQGASNELPA